VAKPPAPAAKPPAPPVTAQTQANRPKPHTPAAPVPPRKKVEADKTDAEFDFGI
jgi:hypothetical protein